MSKSEFQKKYFEARMPKINASDRSCNHIDIECRVIRFAGSYLYREQHHAKQGELRGEFPDYAFLQINLQSYDSIPDLYKSKCFVF